MDEGEEAVVEDYSSQISNDASDISDIYLRENF